jgi:hypothetical protein
VARKVQQKHGGAVNRFEKGDPGGPGRPPKLATSIIRDLKEQGIDRVGRSEVDELIARLQNLPRKKLLEFVKDEANTPIIVALIARGLSGAKGHEFMTRDLWDRTHGRPKQSVDLKEEGEVKHTITFRRGGKVITLGKDGGG